MKMAGVDYLNIWKIETYCFKYIVDKTTILGKRDFKKLSKVVFLRHIKLHFQITNKKI